MVDRQNPFADLELERAIHLRWALRDISAKRLTLSPVNDDDLSLLTERGLVEVQDGTPQLTKAGHDVINLSRRPFAFQQLPNCIFLRQLAPDERRLSVPSLRHHQADQSFATSLAKLSRRPMVRLKTSLSGVESRSLTK